MPCAIWGTPAQSIEKAGNFEVFDSPRAGGRYWISTLALGQLLPFTDNAKLLLTTWLCEQRHSGVDIPKIETNVLDLIKSRRRLSVPRRINDALMFLERNIQQLGGAISIGGNDDNTMRFLAETESRTLQETSALLTMLRDMDLVQGAFSQAGFANVRPSVKGWYELEKLHRPQTDSSQAFIAMWFDTSTTDAFINGIVPALSDTGYKAVRIDKKEHNNKIDDEIIAEIRRSRFLIADFTCESGKARGGVYYEAGFAQGLGIPVIWTCKDTSIADLHFDTRQYAHIVWKDSSDLYHLLRNRIGATIGDGPLPKS